MPGYSYPPYPMPPEPPRRKPRKWLVALVGVWIVAIVAGALWSVRNDPPSVADQRTVAQALPYLENATGAMLAAADGAGRAVVLGGLQTEQDCRITPVRRGVLVARDVTVHVRAGQLAQSFDEIAARLPAAFQPQTAHTAQGTRHDLFADAGEFVSISATARTDDTVFTIRASTGCRPQAALSPASAPAADLPAAFGKAVTALGGSTAGSTQTAVACPGGGVGRTFVSSPFAGPADLGQALLKLVPTTAVVESDPRSWAYRDGDVSIVAGGETSALRVSATVPCR